MQTTAPREIVRRPPLGYQPIYDRLFDQGQQALRQQAHHQDTPPTDGGRWGTSVVFTPDDAGAELLDNLATEASQLAGPGHWATGARGSAHITVRSIERHRTQIPDGDPLVTRCAAAVQRTVEHIPIPVTLRLTGLTLTASSVMACADPIDATADRFYNRLRTELGPDAWFEEQYSRDIWYVSLTHFAGPLANPDQLIDWVHERRERGLGSFHAAAAHVATFTHDGHRPVVTSLAQVLLPGPS